MRLPIFSTETLDNSASFHSPSIVEDIMNITEERLRVLTGSHDPDFEEAEPGRDDGDRLQCLKKVGEGDNKEMMILFFKYIRLYQDELATHHTEHHLTGRSVQKQGAVGLNVYRVLKSSI